MRSLAGQGKTVLVSSHLMSEMAQTRPPPDHRTRAAARRCQHRRVHRRQRGGRAAQPRLRPLAGSGGARAAARRTGPRGRAQRRRPARSRGPGAGDRRPGGRARPGHPRAALREGVAGSRLHGDDPRQRRVLGRRAGRRRHAGDAVVSVAATPSDPAVRTTQPGRSGLREVVGVASARWSVRSGSSSGRCARPAGRCWPCSSPRWASEPSSASEPRRKPVRSRRKSAPSSTRLRSRWPD